MDNKFGFLLKIALLSLSISLLIKYVGPLLAIPGTDAIALFAVLLPSSVLAVLLGMRSRAQI
ncbi:hypothetical protein [Lyngbya sp. CCY1209]|uniref:hypothetical protein n=1 Tax=Lyngbya sp. CCY1209 TaxID=2886103 RepID=UPI002D2181C6|nr:hypothetical protein [Lyngbya sp. CCY1209]MEB3883632.1 hypothetical protein [Lyngbya sp. CCY1209]